MDIGTPEVQQPSLPRQSLVDLGEAAPILATSNPGRTPTVSLCADEATGDGRANQMATLVVHPSATSCEDLNDSMAPEATVTVHPVISLRDRFVHSPSPAPRRPGSHRSPTPPYDRPKAPESQHRTASPLFDARQICNPPSSRPTSATDGRLSPPRRAQRYYRPQPERSPRQDRTDTYRPVTPPRQPHPSRYEVDTYIPGPCLRQARRRSRSASPRRALSPTRERFDYTRGAPYPPRFTARSPPAPIRSSREPANRWVRFFN